MTNIAAIPNVQQSGWDESFDRQEVEQRGPEKPIHVLNSRQLEYVAHIKRMIKELNELERNI